MSPSIPPPARRRDLVRCLVCAAVAGLAFAAPPLTAQDRDGAAARRLEDRIRALEREAETLAASARTLLGELRSLEIERDLRAAEADQAAASLTAAQQAVDETRDRLAALEARRADDLPRLRAQLVELYKHGPAGHLRALATVDQWRDLARTVRAVEALVGLRARRIEDHRKALEALRAERAGLDTRVAELQARQQQATAARAAAERALKTHAARIAEVDSRRDLTAAYVGELQVAHDALLRQLAARDEAGPAPPVPLLPFRGALEWPVPGSLVGQFGQTARRLGGTAVRNGVEIAAAAGTSVRAVHDGVAAHAGPFTGFGTLVILDHGRNHFSLYGYLADLSVAVGDTVRSGREIGRVGASPAGPPALYFELRIDGRAVDPVQWLEPR